MNTRNVSKIKIRAVFGSPFHQRSAIGSLESMLATWKEFYLSAHKENKITYDLEQVEEVDRS